MMLDKFPSQIASSSQIAPFTETSQAAISWPSTSSSGIQASPITVPRSKILDAIQERPWSRIFRTPIPSSAISPAQNTQTSSAMDHMVDSSAFAVCQTRILQSTEDLSRLVQNLSCTLKEDKENLDSLIGSARGLVEAAREESKSRENQYLNGGGILVRALIIVDGQLTSMRRTIEKLSDMNSELMRKLVKVDGTAETLGDSEIGRAHV